MNSTPAPAAKLTVDVWADVLCPWCYVGEQRLVTAIERSPHGPDVELRLHTFELDPNAPAAAQSTLGYLSKKYGISEAQARAMEHGLAQKAGAEGLPYEVDRLAANTFDMLRLIHLGTEYGVGWEYLRAMQVEVFSGHEDAFEHATLSRLGEDLGIPAEEIREVLAGDRYADAVRADHREALSLGARGVPFTVVGKRLGIPGAVETSQYGAAIDQAWGARP
ncbi:MAG: DsbA family oxidoreductase [Nigerium sp.]|nr:DsbA family oxidoreductase [Nigerium sp.]